jgi:hypothetical protein
LWRYRSRATCDNRGSSDQHQSEDDDAWQLERTTFGDRFRPRDSPAPCRSELPDTMKEGARAACGPSADVASTSSASRQWRHLSTTLLRCFRGRAWPRHPSGAARRQTVVANPIGASLPRRSRRHDHSVRQAHPKGFGRTSFGVSKGRGGTTGDRRRARISCW